MKSPADGVGEEFPEKQREKEVNNRLTEPKRRIENKRVCECQLRELT